MEDNKILYEDKFVKITDNDLTIFWYYFPFGNNKIISLKDIKNIELEELTLLKGKYKLWGMNLNLIWFAMDFKRPKRHNFISIDTTKKIKPAFTSDKTEEIYNILKAKLKI